METATTTAATELLPVTAKQLGTEASRIASTTFRSDVISESSETQLLIEHTTETAFKSMLAIANQIKKNMYNSLDPVCNDVHLVQWISHYECDSASICGLQEETGGRRNWSIFSVCDRG